MELPGKEPTTVEQTLDQAQPARLHWSERPLPLLAAVMGTKLLLFLFAVAASLPFLPFLPQNGGEETRIILALLVQVVQILTTLAVGFLFLYWLRAARRRHGADCTVDWKAGVPFWVGIALALGYGVLTYARYFAYQPVSAVINFIGTLASGLTSAFLLVLLFPVLEGRFGAVRGTLLFCAATMLLAIVWRFVLYGINEITLGLGQQVQFITIIRNDLLYSLLPYSLESAAGAALGILAYFAASRRLPGAWLLSTALSGLMLLAANSIIVRLPETQVIDRVWTELLAQPVFFLTVLGLALLALAAMRRWKSWQAFSGSAKKLADRVITMGEEE